MAHVNLVEEANNYTNELKVAVARGDESPALAAFKLKNYGAGFAEAVRLFGTDNGDIVRQFERATRYIGPSHGQQQLGSKSAAQDMSKKEEFLWAVQTLLLPIHAHPRPY